MQTLEEREIIDPVGYWLYDCKLTEKGKKKVESLFDQWYAEGWDYTSDDAMKDIEDRACDSHCHPLFLIEAKFSADGLAHVFYFVENEDYVLEFKSEEAYRLDILANELNMLHRIMEQELNRLGA